MPAARTSTVANVQITNSADQELGIDPNPLRVEFGGVQTGAVAAAAALTVVKASAGRLCKVLVTTAGTAQLTFFDNASAASGRVIGIVPANATLGTVLEFLMPAANGITAGGGAGSPAVTVSFV